MSNEYENKKMKKKRKLKTQTLRFTPSLKLIRAHTLIHAHMARVQKQQPIANFTLCKTKWRRKRRGRRYGNTKKKRKIKISYAYIDYLAEKKEIWYTLVHTYTQTHTDTHTHIAHTFRPTQTQSQSHLWPSHAHSHAAAATATCRNMYLQLHNKMYILQEWSIKTSLAHQTARIN